MDWKTFVAAIIASLAWPLVLIALLYILRNELPSLLRRVKGATVAGTTVEFAEALEKGREGAELIEAEHPTTYTPPYSPDDTKLELAKKYPEAAIVSAYKEVEAVLLKVRERLDLPPKSNLRRVVRNLVEKVLVEPETEPFFANFQQARNAAVHAGAASASVTPAGAIEYLGQSRLLVSIFTEALSRLEKDA